MKHIYMLKNLSVLTKVEFFETSTDGTLLSDGNGHNPICRSAELREELVRHCQMKEIPYIKRDEKGIFWCSLFCGDVCILAGPVSLYAMDEIETHRFYSFYRIPKKEEKNIPVLSLINYFSLLKLMGKFLLEKEYEDSRLMFGNGLSEDDFTEMEEGKQRHEYHDEITEHRHHTYQEEKKIWEYLQKGNYDMVRFWNYKLISDAEILSEDSHTHWYNMAIVAITLCTRAAIESGMMPTDAYHLSGFYIRKLNIHDEIIDIQHVLDNALRDLTEQVQKKKARHSNYTEQFKDYVSAHYREKIFLEDISSAMGISRGYLSRVFKEETGVTCQEYIIMLRVDRAANMLKYSNETIAYISDYVNFPNQSYFGEKFKKYKHMTPRDYREQHKPLEF